MQRLESCRPSQPVRSPPASMRKPLKTPRYRGISQIWLGLRVRKAATKGLFRLLVSEAYFWRLIFDGSRTIALLFGRREIDFLPRQLLVFVMPASGVHIVGEPHARKDQQADETQGDGVNDHTMPILIVAFRAFVFREVWDRRVISSSTRLRPTPSRRPHSRRKSYHTVIIVVVAVDIHGATRRYRLCATFASRPHPVVRSRIATTRGPSASRFVSCFSPFSQTWMRSR
jgi:hypothetical protein